MANPNIPIKADYNTYIGARYVPIVAGMWDKSLQYEPLTIVMYQGSSYTSKTYVPVNTDITNTDYWVRTANYDEQVEFYRSEVQQFKKDIDASEAEYIQTVQSAMNNFTDVITNQQQTYENNITNRQTNFENTITKQQNDYQTNTTNLVKAYQSPIFVNATSDMTDTNKIYVLISNNHIYAYNGTEITDTGSIYGSEINATTIYPKLITNDNYSSVITSLDTLPVNKEYILFLTSKPDDTSFPDSPLLNYPLSCTITTKSYGKSYDDGALQYIKFYPIEQYANLNEFYRIYGTGKWTAWLDDLASLIKVGFGNLSYHNISDINDCLNNVVYIEYFISKPSISNLPENITYPSLIKVLTYSSQSVSVNLQVCTAICSDNLTVDHTFYRIESSDKQWSDWKETTLFSETVQVTSDNYTNVLPDINNANYNCVYVMALYDDEKIPSNMPEKMRGVYTLFSLHTKDIYNVQILIQSSNVDSSSTPCKIWFRYDLLSWNEVSSNNNMLFMNTNSGYNDLNDLPDNTTSMYWYYPSESYVLSNLPNDNMLGALIITTKKSNNGNKYQKLVHIEYGESPKSVSTYYRYTFIKEDNTWAWTNWVCSSNKYGVKGTTEKFTYVANNIQYIAESTNNEPSYNTNNNTVTGYITFPSTYNSAIKNKWCIIFHGAGKDSENWNNTDSYLNIRNALTNAGYCVVIFNGYSDTDFDWWGIYKGTMATYAMINAVKTKYNLDDSYVAYGFSMGGLNILNFIATGAVGCKAFAIGSPALDLEKDIEDDPAIASTIYGGTSGVYDESLMVGSNPMSRILTINNKDYYLGNIPPMFAFMGNNETSGLLDNAICKRFTKAVQNSGNIAFYRGYDGGHEVCYGSNSDAINQMLAFFSTFYK